ncbi:hypothetical protein P9112_011024 [Eukaryota sp. TZLM1-RC]
MYEKDLYNNNVTTGTELKAAKKDCKIYNAENPQDIEFLKAVASGDAESHVIEKILSEYNSDSGSFCTVQWLAGHPDKLYLAVGSANFPSHCRKANPYGSARAFRKSLCYQKDVKHMSTSEFNTSKLSSCCMAENIQAGSWQMCICTECQIEYDPDISAAKNIQIKKKAELWLERYICPDALLRR